MRYQVSLPFIIEADSPENAAAKVDYLVRHTAPHYEYIVEWEDEGIYDSTIVYI